MYFQKNHLMNIYNLQMFWAVSIWMILNLQITRIKDQQQKINDLKANLMDDLNERGILDNQECQEIIQRYKQVLLSSYLLVIDSTYIYSQYVVLSLKKTLLLIFDIMEY